MKTKLKLSLIITFVLAGVFSLFFFSNTEVFAQAAKETIKIETTGYSVLSSNSFVFGGFFSGNFDKKGFTTYFEFKKNDPNLDIDAEKTIVIKRHPNADEYGYFYTSPELNLFSDYYFRAVGCFEENSTKDDDCSKHDSTKKYYGETLYMRTGYIPINTTIPLSWGMISSEEMFPFSVTKDNKIIEFDIPDICKASFLGSNLSGICNTKISPPVPKPLDPKNIVSKPATPIPTPPTPSQGKEPTGLVPCTGSASDPCEFPQFLQLINKVIDFVFKGLVLPIAALMFAYAGFELLTSGGSTEKKSKAKSIFINVAIGLAVAAAAFLIIQTILSIVGARTDIGINWFGFLK